MNWQLVGFGLAVLFGFLPFAVKDMPHWITLPGIAVGLLFGIWGLIPGHDRAPFVPTIVFILCCTGAVASAAWIFDRISEDTISGSIFIEARNLTPLPPVYPADGKIEVLFLRPHTLAAGAQKQLVVTNNSGIPGAMIKWPKSNSPFSSFASRYEITNDTGVPLRELTIPLQIAHGSPPNNRLINMDLTMTRLDPGPDNRSVIYVVNQTPDGGAITTRGFAMALRPDDPFVRKVRITLPTNPVFHAVLYTPFTPAEQDTPQKKPTVSPK